MSCRIERPGVEMSRLTFPLREGTLNRTSGNPARMTNRRHRKNVRVLECSIADVIDCIEQSIIAGRSGEVRVRFVISQGGIRAVLMETAEAKNGSCD